MPAQQDLTAEQLTRTQEIEEIVGEIANGILIVNGNEVEVPSPVPKYLAVEFDNDVNDLWVYFADSLEAIGKLLESSDTDGVDGERVYDLDTGRSLDPIWKVAGYTDHVD
jgi:hypothetical protein